MRFLPSAVEVFDLPDVFFTPATTEWTRALFPAAPRLAATEAGKRVSIPFLRIDDHESGFLAGRAVVPLDLHRIRLDEIDVDLGNMKFMPRPRALWDAVDGRRCRLVYHCVAPAFSW
jgi:hypothetical protein